MLIYKILVIEKNILNKYFNNDLCIYIFKYANEYVLLDWIDVNKLNYDSLSENPNGIDLLEKNQNKINWRSLSKNSNAIHLL